MVPLRSPYGALGTWCVPCMMGYSPSTRGEHMVMVPYVTNSMGSMAGEVLSGVLHPG